MADGNALEGNTDIDIDAPNVARVYDYMLGGKNNFPVDRKFGERLMAAFPESAWIARQNRAFVGRAVRHCAGQGVTQFLDLGSGLPTMENVHQVVRQVCPEATVIYVDNDPVALSHANALLATSDGVTALLGDLREPAGILANAEATGLIDLSRPVVVLLAAILHFITDEEDPAGIVATFVKAMQPGSYLILSTATHDTQPDESSRATRMYRSASSPLVTRSRREITALFAGLDMVEPGVTFTSLWRQQPPADAPAEPTDLFGGVGRKP